MHEKETLLTEGKVQGNIDNKNSHIKFKNKVIINKHE